MQQEGIRQASDATTPRAPFPYAWLHLARSYWYAYRVYQAQVNGARIDTRGQPSAAYRAWFRRQPHPYLPFLVAVRQNWLFSAQNQRLPILMQY